MKQLLVNRMVANRLVSDPKPTVKKWFQWHLAKTDYQKHPGAYEDERSERHNQKRLRISAFLRKMLNE